MLHASVEHGLQHLPVATQYPACADCSDKQMWGTTFSGHILGASRDGNVNTFGMGFLATAMRCPPFVPVVSVVIVTY